MKPRLFVLLLALLPAFAAQGQEALSGIRLTDEQLLYGIPDDIVRPVPMPVEFRDAGTLVYMAGRDRFAWSAKTGLSTPVPPAPMIRYFIKLLRFLV